MPGPQGGTDQRCDSFFRLSVSRSMPVAQIGTFRAADTVEHEQKTPRWKSNPAVSVAVRRSEEAETGGAYRYAAAGSCGVPVMNGVCWLSWVS